MDTCFQPSPALTWGLGLAQGAGNALERLGGMCDTGLQGQKETGPRSPPAVSAQSPKAPEGSAGFRPSGTDGREDTRLAAGCLCFLGEGLATEPGRTVQAQREAGSSPQSQALRVAPQARTQVLARRCSRPPPPSPVPPQVAVPAAPCRWP